MGAIAVAIIIGLVAVGLVGVLLAFSAIMVAGLKAINAVHDGGVWFLNRRQRVRAH